MTVYSTLFLFVYASGLLDEGKAVVCSRGGSITYVGLCIIALLDSGLHISLQNRHDGRLYLGLRQHR